MNIERIQGIYYKITVDKVEDSNIDSILKVLKEDGSFKNIKYIIIGTKLTIVASTTKPLKKLNL